MFGCKRVAGGPDFGMSFGTELRASFVYAAPHFLSAYEHSNREQGLIHGLDHRLRGQVTNYYGFGSDARIAGVEKSGR